MVTGRSFDVNGDADFDSDEELLFALEEVGNREKTLKMSDEEWISMWMLEAIQK